VGKSLGDFKSFSFNVYYKPVCDDKVIFKIRFEIYLHEVAIFALPVSK
jgi:hypothetical protein